MQSNLKFESSN